jgi:mutator protein MutT
MASPPPIDIGIAIVVHAGRVLVGIRGEDVPLAGFAEFPGGKCSPGESPETCAVRECEEETGLSIAPLRLLDQREWTYPHATVRLHFFLCRPHGAVDVGQEARGFRWRLLAELATLRFPDANAEVIQRLLNGELLP